MAVLHDRSLLVLAIVSVSVLGCEDDAAPAGAPSSGAGPSPGAGTVVLEIPTFDVPPGTERQVCTTLNLPVDAPMLVVRMKSTMEGVSHHFNVYKALENVATPASSTQAEVHDCAPGAEQQSGAAAYIFGAAEPERVFETPEGVAFELQPKHRIILEQHVINTTSGIIQGGAKLELTAAAPGAPIAHHADIMWFANWNFFIGANEKTTATTHCTVPYAVEIFGLMSHTHALGSHFSIERWKGGATAHLYDSQDWAHPLYQPHAPPLSLAAGEGLEWTCTWTNTRGAPVYPGKNSTDEMCMTFAAAYPKEGLAGEPIQCNLY